MNRQTLINVFIFIGFCCMAAGAASAQDAAEGYTVPSTKASERVVLLHAVGSASEDIQDQVVDLLGEEITALGFEVTGEPLPPDGTERPHPDDGNEMRAVAEMSSAAWAIAPRVDGDLPPYKVQLQVGYAPEGSFDEGSVELVSMSRGGPLPGLLRKLLRRHEIIPKSEDKEEEPDPEEDASGTVAENQPESPKHSGSKLAYGETFPFHVQLRGGLGGIVAHSAQSRGGTIGIVGGRIGYAPQKVSWLELRLGLDGVLGRTAGVAFLGGAAVLAGPLGASPVYLGADLELGVFRSTTGSRSASFILRGSPLLGLRFAQRFTVEAAFLELKYLSAGSGALGIGGAVRAGLRF